MDKVRARCRVRAKFHYTDPTGPARTQRSFAAKKSVRVRVVEFSSSPTMCADFVRVGSGPCRVRVVEFSYNQTDNNVESDQASPDASS